MKHNKDALKYIEEEIQERIESFDSKRKFYRNRTNQFTLYSALLAAITTFLIGVSQAYSSKTLSVISLATSSGMTVLSAWNGLYNYKRRWIQNNDTLMQLYQLNSDIKYEKTCFGSELSMDLIDQFYSRYQKILNSANESWKEDRLSDDKE